MPYQTFADAPTATSSSRSATTASTAKFVEAGGRPELASDPRFATNPARVRNRDVLVPLLARHGAATQREQQWIAPLEAAGVPCGPINDLDEVFDDPQVQRARHGDRPAASDRPAA